MHTLIFNSITKFVKYRNRYFRHYSLTSKTDLKPPWNVLFFGTDEFSVESLKALYVEYKKGDLLSNLEVVTSLKAKKNPVEVFSLKEKLVLHSWPINSLQCTRFHVGLVVSFGHLIPEDIINSFPLGMLNVHASLLPRWRGAAPIIYAIAHGDERTGITIMKLKPHKFDVGEIIEQATVEIPHHMKMPDLYFTLANLGAQTLAKTLKEMPNNLLSAKEQSAEGVTLAPRVNSKMATVKWDNMSAHSVYNLARALTGMFQLSTTFNGISVKLYHITESDHLSTDNVHTKQGIIPGSIVYCKNNKVLKIQCMDGKWINVEKIGIPGKKIMSAADFNNGFLSKHNLRIFR